MRGTRIRGPFPSDDNGCKATDIPGFHRNKALRGVLRRGELESGVSFPEKPIGRPGTNGNRSRGKRSLILD